MLNYSLISGQFSLIEITFYYDSVGFVVLPMKIMFVAKNILLPHLKMYFYIIETKLSQSAGTWVDQYIIFVLFSIELSFWSPWLFISYTVVLVHYFMCARVWGESKGPLSGDGFLYRFALKLNSGPQAGCLAPSAWPSPVLSSYTFT